MASDPSSSRPRHPAEMGLLSRTLHGIMKFLSWLVLALLFSILLEWIGMVFWWPEQGINHSQAMLVQELRYANQDLRQNILVSRPLQFAAQSSETLYHYLFEVTHVVEAIRWLKAPEVPHDSRFRQWLQPLVLPLLDYVLAAMMTTQVFGVRLAVLALASPIFVLFGVVALTDGLVQRDLRRWCGGWESSFVYHYAKHFVLPLPVAAWILYLSLPVSLHPNAVILPFAVLFALALGIMAATFKKYL